MFCLFSGVDPILAIATKIHLPLLMDSLGQRLHAAEEAKKRAEERQSIINLGQAPGDAPFKILHRPYQIGGAGSGSIEFNQALGLPVLGYILDFLGLISAIVIIAASLIKLMIVAYPKKVSQSKETIAHALMVVIMIALLPLIMDIIYSLIVQALGLTIM